MASIDRYRPPREGYQPPSLPAGSRPDQAAKSPPRPPDVPPAVPTPPQHSRRVSSNASASSQTRDSPGGKTPLPGTNQWCFTLLEVESTPSIVEGLQPSEERLRRAKGVNFIYQVGVMLDLPQITLWVAGVFFHRFFMRCSMVQEKGGIHHYNIAATALFLANKVEENCRKTKDIIIAVAKVAQKNAKLIIDEQSKEYWRWRDSILTYEEVMLEQLTFDLMIDNPYRHLFELLGQLDIVHNKHLRQAAWAFCNDACLTALPLLIDARDVAISAVFFASIHTSHKIDDIDGEAWWKVLNGDEEKCVLAIRCTRQFYTENPLKKQNPSLPSPAYHLENTRRREDALLGHGDPMSSQAATPMEVDRNVGRSPGRRANGSTDRDELMRSKQTGNNDIRRSPAKRRQAWTEGDEEDRRARKQGKLSEDEEGEVVDE